MNLDIVIRPSGVWDTRAPFNTFLRHHNHINDVFHSLNLVIGWTSLQVHLAGAEMPARQFLVVKRLPKVHALSFPSYQTTLTSGPEKRTPTAADIRRSMQRALPSITHQALVSLSATFETFCQCWALNMLLSSLERSIPWTGAQRTLAKRCWPIGDNRHFPSMHDIVRAFPVLRDELSALPHIFKHPTTKAPVIAPLTPRLSSYAAVLFWRDWRNVLVHGGGMVSEHFANKHRAFLHEARQTFPIGDMVVGQVLPLKHASFRAAATVHYRAAHRLREVLADYSQSRRGHLAAPGPRIESGDYVAPKPMLIEGDHELSYRWTADPRTRTDLRNQLQQVRRLPA